MKKGRMIMSVVCCIHLFYLYLMIRMKVTVLNFRTHVFNCRDIFNVRAPPVFVLLEVEDSLPLWIIVDQVKWIRYGVSCLSIVYWKSFPSGAFRHLSNPLLLLSSRLMKYNQQFPWPFIVIKQRGARISRSDSTGRRQTVLELNFNLFKILD